MTISQNDRTSILFKKVTFGVTETTADGKAPTEENIPSPVQVFADQILAESASIPAPASAVVDIVEEYTNLELIQDPSVTSGQTWVAVENPSLSLNDPAQVRLIDWIPFTIDGSYEVRIYRDAALTQRLLPGTNNQEWIFDYVAGVLHFPNTLPTGVTQLFLTGFRYIGMKGIETPSGPGGNSEVMDFSHETQMLMPGEFEDISFGTGQLSTLIDTIVSHESLIEAFSSPTRDDTNPYTFRATTAQLFDDGSYVQGGERFFGPRYTQLFAEDGINTHWRITNESGVPAHITLDIKVAKI